MARYSKDCEQLRTHMDLLIHAANALPGRGEGLGAMFFDFVAAMYHNPEGPPRFDHQTFTSYARLQMGAEVIWSIGDTLNVPMCLSGAIYPVLVLPNNTKLNSTSRVNEAANARFPRMLADLARPVKDGVGHDPGWAVRLKGEGGFAAIVHVVCRKPGDPTLLALQAGLEGAFAVGEDKCGHLSIPIWGEESDLAVWADALAGIVSGFCQFQKHARMPIALRFRPEDRARAEAIERMLVRRCVLVGREDDPKLGTLSEKPPAIPDEVVRLVGKGGPICPLTFARWMSRGAFLHPDVWRRHVQIFGDGNK